jgi:molybdopterin synthase catalytic subunit
MSNFIQLTFNPLDVNVILHKLKSPTTGAISVFIGTTRDTFDGQRVKRLEYEAYQTMAVKKITQVCENLRQQWDVFNIAIYHRLGEVEPEEASVVIAITSKHRKDALSAVQVTFK